MNSGDTENRELKAETRNNLSDWVAGGYVLLALVPAWLCLGYVVLSPAWQGDAAPVAIASTFDAGEADCWFRARRLPGSACFTCTAGRPDPGCAGTTHIRSGSKRRTRSTGNTCGRPIATRPDGSVSRVSRTVRIS